MWTNHRESYMLVDYCSSILSLENESNCLRENLQYNKQYVKVTQSEAGQR